MLLIVHKDLSEPTRNTTNDAKKLLLGGDRLVAARHGTKPSLGIDS